MKKKFWGDHLSNGRLKSEIGEQNSSHCALPNTGGNYENLLCFTPPIADDERRANYCIYRELEFKLVLFLIFHIMTTSRMNDNDKFKQ